MGNNHFRPIRFLQSPADFPLTVSLGKTTPSFGLHRFKQALRFVPPDDEGFTLRGDKQRLMYSGRRRSHRFTILGNDSFEYDCILLKEPETNVIALRMEGAENFDFFRQPDFLKGPLLAGSYAVYKKETLIGEGTGKLCHIHRPEIIDARGRRCWGDLSVIGNELRVTIPEWFLSDAKYPIIVDPTVGTTTVGSQYLVEYEPPEYPWAPLYFELAIPVNRFLIPETINGTCTAYIYAYEDDWESGGRAVFYSDNGNAPLTRKSTNEALINLHVNGSQTAAWRTGTFKSNGSIAGGSYMWFGVFTEYMWYPRFDYGAKCYHTSCYDFNGIPNSYPLDDVADYDNYKLSMYFTYSSAQNYARTLTQGVKLSDTRKLIGNYKRKTTQTTWVNSILKRYETFIRKCMMTVHNSMTINRLPLFIRNLSGQINVTMQKNEKMSFSRSCADDVKVNSNTARIQDVLRTIQDNLRGLDTQFFSVLIVRSIHDTATDTDFFNHPGAFFRGLLETARNTAETTHSAEYKRIQTDSVQAHGTVFRGLLFFIRIVSSVFIRDYVLRRFLKARKELVLKSAICRELTLNSTIEQEQIWGEFF